MLLNEEQSSKIAVLSPTPGNSPNNHFELTQRILNLKFMNKIKQISLNFGACISIN